MGLHSQTTYDDWRLHVAGVTERRLLDETGDLIPAGPEGLEVLRTDSRTTYGTARRRLRHNRTSRWFHIDITELPNSVHW